MSEKLDIVIIGATGYTGKITAKYLHSRGERAGRWAIAGRDQSKLTQLKQELGVSELPTFVIDISQPATLDAVCAQTRCIISCAGPFTRVGMPVVEACVRNHVHYIDSTGEFNFIRLVAERFHEQAKREGVVLVPGCGFDSVPSDIGNYVLHRQSRDEVTSVKAYYTLTAAGFSSGTVASMVAVGEALKPEDAGVNSLVPHDTNTPPRELPLLRGMHYDTKIGAWTVPFVMASSNIRVVRRSNALRGSSAAYDEVMRAPTLMKSLKSMAGLFGMRAVLAFGPVRRFVLQRMFPTGTAAGPAEAAKEHAHFSALFVGETALNRTLRVEVSSQREMYDLTGVFLGEAALSAVTLAKANHIKTGVLTPTVAFGDDLVQRCVENGLEIQPEFTTTQ